MCLSQKTIANYQSIVRQKLELTNAAQIVRLAMSYGLLEQTSAAAEGDS
jgi:DNA-binding CsgD family transcriptional regulator